MNIFYDNVDKNLQDELNMRGQAGMQDRTNKSLNFMLAKIANVQCTAYEGTGSASRQITEAEFGILGGGTTRTDRYLPSGPNGFLTTRELNRTEIDFYETGKEDEFIKAKARAVAAGDSGLAKPPQLGDAYINTLPVYTDTSKRIGPYLTSIDVTIGDHSMGLLNKATISFMVPNAERDLDAIENTWFHPGRFVKLDIVHPDSAIISKDEKGNNGLLLQTTVPNIEKLIKLYPGYDANKATKLQSEIRRMNIFTFEGLITSFEFSYTPDGGVEATLQLTGTSNVYADISMYLPGSSEEKAAKEAAAKINSDPALGKNNVIIPPTGTSIFAKVATAVTTAVANNINSFYAELSRHFNQILNDYDIKHDLPTKAGKYDILTKYYSSSNREADYRNTQKSTDQYILAGRMYDITSRLAKKPIVPPTSIGNIIPTFGPPPPPPIMAPLLAPPTPPPFPPGALVENPVGTYERYITLGALIQFINEQIFLKLDPANPTELKPIGIIHTDTQCYSNFYSQLTSCTPHKILFLPKNPSNIGGMNWHDKLGYYADIVNKKNAIETKEEMPWSGVHETLSNDKQIMYPSRIFINLTRISEIATSLGQKNAKTFTVSAFLSVISSDIMYASGGAISLKLVSDKTDISKLIFVDTAYLKSIDLKNEDPVLPYSVPMFANHPFGSVVRDFKFSATLPESAKNLSYVLNSGDKVTNDQIAPYMNFMYNSKNPAAINAAMQKYKARHKEIMVNLMIAKQTNAQWPYSWNTADGSGAGVLYKALSDYIKMPTDDIQKSQQITAPIFPFTAEFTIDGINGLRYGDVLKFNALPKKYRANTVFSVISVTHNVSNTGEWKTAVKCIMRPSIS